MAENDNNGLTPTQEILSKYQETLGKNVEEYKSMRDGKAKERLTQDKIEQYKICLYVKARETNTTYTNLKFFVSEGANNEANEIQTVVTALKSKNNDLKTKIEQAASALKSIKKAMNEAVESACRLDRSKEEEKRCNIDIYNALQDGVPEIWSKIAEIKTATDENFKKISDAFDGLVDIAGIQTFPDFDSMDNHCTELKNKTASLKTDVEGNITSSAGKMSGAATALTETQKNITKIKFEKSAIVSTLKGKEDMKTFVDTPNCPADPLSAIEEACKQIQYDELANLNVPGTNPVQTQSS